MKKLILSSIFSISLFGATAQQFNMGLDFDDAAYAKTPVKKRELTRSYEKLPPRVDLRPFCPIPQQQGDYGMCVGWAIGYAACTVNEAVLRGTQNKNLINEIASSPTYVYAQGKSEKENDTGCKRGAKMEDALNKLKGGKVPRHRTFRDVCTPLDKLPKAVDEGVKLSDYNKLFKNEDTWEQKLQQIKKTLSDKKPIVVGILCYKSLMSAKGTWSGKQDEYIGGHAVCIVGYDDEHQGGAVEIMNSWGAEWGDKGFTKIKYKDLESVLKYAYEIRMDAGQTEKPAPTFASTIRLKLADTETEMPTVPFLSNSTRGQSVVKAFVPHYKTSKGYNSGTKYRVFIDLSEATYLYVLGSDLTGQITKLFPADESMTPYISNPNAHIALPDEQWFIELDDNKGKDYTIFIYSKEPLQLDGLLEQWNGQKGTALEKIYKGFAGRILNENVLNLSKNEMAFKTALDAKNLVVVTLEMEHF